MGYAALHAAGVLVWANVGGLAGAVLLSVLSWRLPLRSLLVAAMAMAIGSLVAALALLGLRPLRIARSGAQP